MQFRPSSLPMLAACACFVSGETEWTQPGTNRHAALAKHYNGDDSVLNQLPEEEADGVRWAAEYIRMTASSDSVVEFEKPLELPDPQDPFSPIRKGTADAACRGSCYTDLFDLKWRRRDYTPQMADYAQMLIASGYGPEIRVHVLFAECRRVETLKLTAEDAAAIVDPIIARATDEKKQPAPCDYCNWCANRIRCKAYVDRANAVAAGRDDWKIEQFHPSEIISESEMATALRLARMLTGWCKSVEFHAREMVVKQGKQIPGFELKSKNGRKYCTSVTAAFSTLGLPQDRFLEACDLRLNTSKKYPEKKGVIDLLAAFLEIKKAPAKREAEKRLGEVLQTGKPTLSLVATDGDDSDESETE